MALSNRGEDSSNESAPVAPEFVEPTTSRFVLGTCFFLLGIFCPLFIPLVAITALPTEWKAALSGVLLLGAPEAFILVAVAILGKPGYEAMKYRLLSVLRRLRPAEQVGRVRHRVGVAMFVLPAFAGWVYPYVSLWLTELADHELELSLVLDAIFFSSLFVLGGDFWDKLRALFVHTQAAE